VNCLVINLVDDLILTAIALGYVFACVLIPKYLVHKELISKFAARKAVHLLAGLAIFITPYLTIPWFAVLIAVLLTIVTLKSSKQSSNPTLRDLYNSIGEEAEESKGYLQGPFHYCLSITILIATFSAVYQISALYQAKGLSLFYIPIAGILIMVISDTMAAVVGKRWGKHEIKIPWIHSRRTFEGSLTFFLTGILLCLFSFFVFGVLLPGYSIQLTVVNALILSVVTAAVGTVVEMMSPSTWDDLTVPLITTGLISIMAFGFGLIVIT